MKLFLSWSGEKSKATAELLKHWLKVVIQASSPWISTEDIDRGSIWFRELYDQLRDSNHGIICLTVENHKRDWILFEAGALSKGLTESKIYTFLVV